MEENLRQLQQYGDSKILKIALFGPESTGKTTLAIQLAEHFKTAWTPEFARDYLQEKWNKTQQICQVEDMLPIAYGQTQLENESLIKAKKFLFCDTNLMVTKVFSEVYYNYCDPKLDQAAKEHEYDLVFLTDIDVPWEKDDLRDNAEKRDAVFAIFKETLIKNNKAFITLSGDKTTRLNNAITICTNLKKAKDMNFSSQDFVQIQEHGIPMKNIQEQLDFFKNGITKTDLVEAATLGNGILQLSDNEFKEKAAYFDANKFNIKLEKFVPASGAASRMFKFLNEFLNEFDIEKETINDFISRKNDKDLPVFIAGLKQFAFFNEVNQKLKELYPDFDSLSPDYKNYYFIKTLIEPDYFDYANKPKGVLAFHKYNNHNATAVEEHLNECDAYASSNGKSNLHFTVSETHLPLFENAIAAVKNKVETETNTAINIDFSFQNKSTDTIAVDTSNEPFRENGKLVFRPGGHGALIENLNQIKADVVFIKNIDNVIQNQLDQIALYKKALAAVLLELQQETFRYLSALENNREINLDAIMAFAKDKLKLKISDNYSSLSSAEKANSLSKLLNRPIRVCGMVKNEGEAGGGPFWVRDSNGVVSLQIVESSQVDMENPAQVEILKTSSHFNPVDLVCGIRNYKNEAFDLSLFVDKNTGFIVEKNKNGQTVKSYELPGLWNGAMANWITIFVEVPLITFNPVKTVNDLLKPAHQL